MNQKHHQEYRRLLAAMLAAVMLLFSCAAALAEDPALPQVTVSWTDGEGNPQYAVSAPVAGAEGSYWILLPAGTDFSALSMSIYWGIHPEYIYTLATASGEGTDLSQIQVSDAGSEGNEWNRITVTYHSPEGEPLGSFALYLSTQTGAENAVIAAEPTEEPTPEPTEEPTPEPTE
ncbi:MAG: hypothetical protein E7325_09680, partial [Clostridiales bacterium]|nr:hypothetical protein [Clostridiales bacterium]